MKKLLVLIAVALSAGLVYAQDAENVGNSAQLSIIPRVDLNPLLGYNGPTEFSYQNTGLYALLEGTFADNFSYTGHFHFTDAYDPGYFYKYPFTPGESFFVNMAYLTYAPGTFAFTLGKNAMAIGTFEMEDWDHDVYYEQASTFWNDFSLYQWGGDISYYFNDDAYAAFQVLSSPFSERTFSEGLMSYAFKLSDQSHDFAYMFSGNLIDTGTDEWMKMLNAGVKYSFGDFAVGLDASYRSLFGHTEDYFGLNLAYSPNEKFNFKGKLNFENVHNLEADWEYAYSYNERMWGGVVCEYFPLRDSDALRLHAAITHMPFAGQVSINVGATFNLALNLY